MSTTPLSLCHNDPSAFELNALLQLKMTASFTTGHGHSDDAESSQSERMEVCSLSELSDAKVLFHTGSRLCSQGVQRSIFITSV